MYVADVQLLFTDRKNVGSTWKLLDIHDTQLLYYQRTYSNLFKAQGFVAIYFDPSTDNSKNHKGGISNVKFSYNTFSN